jgi:hypothetical protein
MNFLKLKNYLFLLFTVLIINFIFLSCKSINEYNNLENKISYLHRDHFGTASISLGDNNKFSQFDHIDPFKSKKYYGTYNIETDTLWLNYVSKKRPKNQLPYCILTDTTIIVFELYERFKEKYGYINPDSMKNIKKSELFRLDTAKILYRKY